MKVDVIRAKRRTVLLRVNVDGSVCLKVPMKYPSNKIEEFLFSKKNWIAEKIQLVTGTTNKLEDVDGYKKLYLFGETYDLLYHSDKKIVRVDDKFFIPNLPPDKINKVLRKWYEQIFAEEIVPMVNKIGEGLKVDFTLESMHSRKKWGSFDSNRLMRLNYMVCALPKELITYIIFHEFCHSYEMNHSQAFWKRLKKIYPDYATSRKNLKDFSFLLLAYNNLER